MKFIFDPKQKKQKKVTVCILQMSTRRMKAINKAPSAHPGGRREMKLVKQNKVYNYAPPKPQAWSLLF